MIVSDFVLSEKQRPTSNSAGKFVADVTPRLEQVGGILENRSTTWGIELEDGILPSDSSSLVTTVVIDTGGIWNLQERMQQPLQIAVDYCGEPRSLITRIPDESSRSPPHVASRFFFERVTGSSPRGDFPRVSTPDRRDPPNWEPVTPTLDSYPDYPCPDVGWDDSSGQETDLSLGDYRGTHLSPQAGACVRCG